MVLGFLIYGGGGVCTLFLARLPSLHRLDTLLFFFADFFVDCNYRLPITNFFEEILSNYKFHIS
ncbi:hypothetical protein Hanom_Chr04g00328381 [Helianthus anomalus]